MSVEDALRAQDWGRITAQLTFFAFKRTQRRSWQLAEDLAHDAIAQAFDHNQGWDPARGTLMKYLAQLVVGYALNDRRRKRNVLEDYVDDEALAAFADGAASVEAQVARRQTVDLVVDRLSSRLADDPIGARVLGLMTEGIETPADQVAATSLSIEEIRRARRRLFDHAERVATEMSREREGGLPS
ncbi:MAG: hypothetical protein ACHREM_20575 [Polyangiales bacterium]